MIKILKSLFKSDDTEEKSNKADKKNFEILKYDGLRAQRIGRIDYAVKCFENALNIEEEFETMNYLAQLYLSLQRLDDARTLFERMTLLEPEAIDTLIALGNVHYIQEEYARVIEVAERAISIAPDSLPAYYLMAKALWKMNQHEKAIEQLSIAIDKRGDFAEALLLRAELYFEVKQYEATGKDIAALLALNPEEEHALLLFGKLKQATGYEDEAEKAFSQVIGLNPFHEQAYIDLAELFIAQKHLEKTIVLLDEAIEINPNSANTYRERGKAKLLNGDKEGARQDEQEYMRLAATQVEEGVTPVVNTQSSGSGVLGGL